MKTKMKYPITAMALSLVLTGCEPPKSSDSANSPAHVSTRDVTKKINEAADATRSYVAENKDQFVASMQEKLNTLDQQLSELGAKTETLKNEAKADGDKALAALREQRVQLGQKFEVLRNSSKEAWKDVQAGVESAYAELEKAYQNAKAKFGG